MHAQQEQPSAGMSCRTRPSHRLSLRSPLRHRRGSGHSPKRFQFTTNAPCKSRVKSMVLFTPSPPPPWENYLGGILSYPPLGSEMLAPFSSHILTTCTPTKTTKTLPRRHQNVAKRHQHVTQNVKMICLHKPFAHLGSFKAPFSQNVVNS